MSVWHRLDHPWLRQFYREVRLGHARWKLEHQRVSTSAVRTNLQRVRWMAPTMLLFNVLAVFGHGLQLLLSSAQGDESSRLWALMAAHLSSALVMAAGWVMARRLRHAHRGLAAQALPLALLATGMLLGMTAAGVNQWVTPSLAPFLMGCLLCSLLLYVRPSSSAVFYGLAYMVFFCTMGWAQSDEVLRLSLRMDGLWACAAGFAFSLVLWRHFTTETLQREDLERAHAELKKKQSELESLTRVDGLTGVLNRSTLVELTSRELARAARQSTNTSLLLLDLDHFKHVNDTWGHPTGDAVLQHVASLCANTVRSTDLVGRLGGEEFIVLLPVTGKEAADLLAEKLRRRIEATPARTPSNVIAVTVSMGLSASTPGDVHSFESLYALADKNLYRAKQQGRNRVV
jgi:diguanylate cyclase (GGDEF)-like protein